VVFDAGTDDVGEPSEVGTGGGEFVAADEQTIVPKSLLDPIVVENGEGDRSLADPTSTNESDWSEVLGEIDNLLDQLVASEEGPSGGSGGGSPSMLHST